MVAMMPEDFALTTNMNNLIGTVLLQTAFNFFAQEMWNLAKEQVGPAAPSPDVSRLVGEMWARTDDSARAPYILMAQQDKNRYIAELAAWRAAQGMAQEEAALAAAAAAGGADSEPAAAGGGGGMMGGGGGSGAMAERVWGVAAPGVGDFGVAGGSGGDSGPVPMLFQPQRHMGLPGLPMGSSGGLGGVVAAPYDLQAGRMMLLNLPEQPQQQIAAAAVLHPQAVQQHPQQQQQLHQLQSALVDQIRKQAEVQKKVQHEQLQQQQDEADALQQAQAQQEMVQQHLRMQVQEQLRAIQDRAKQQQEQQ
jgi:hypothetical protein